MRTPLFALFTLWASTALAQANPLQQQAQAILLDAESQWSGSERAMNQGDFGGSENFALSCLNLLTVSEPVNEYAEKDKRFDIEVNRVFASCAYNATMASFYAGRADEAKFMKELDIQARKLGSKPAALELRALYAVKKQAVKSLEYAVLAAADYSPDAAEHVALSLDLALPGDRKAELLSLALKSIALDDRGKSPGFNPSLGDQSLRRTVAALQSREGAMVLQLKNQFSESKAKRLPFNKFVVKALSD